MAAHSSVLPGPFHGQRSLAGYSPCGRKKSDTTDVTQHSAETVSYDISLSLTSLSVKIPKSVHAAANDIISFYLWLSNISSIFIVCVYHLFLIHSSVDGHLNLLTNKNRLTDLENKLTVTRGKGWCGRDRQRLWN